MLLLHHRLLLLHLPCRNGCFSGCALAADENVKSFKNGLSGIRPPIREALLSRFDLCSSACGLHLSDESLVECFAEKGALLGHIRLKLGHWDAILNKHCPDA